MMPQRMKKFMEFNVLISDSLIWVSYKFEMIIFEMALVYSFRFFLYEYTLYILKV